MRKLFFISAWTGIISIAIAIVVISYWLIAPYEVMTFYGTYGKETRTLEVPTANTVKSGEYLALRESYCKNLSYPATVSRTFIDGISYQVPVYVSNIPVGCYGKDGESIDYVYIPKALPPGKYRIETVYSFQVNPLRTVHFSLITDQFIIVK